jgi:glycosyltransferase involved in cell wall biosynthesis
MKFSIVVPTYNEEKDIAKTLDALVALAYEDKEIIVVDDSSDRTPDIVKMYDPKVVTLIRPEKREGRCGARNRGILASRGDVVVILNADVQPKPDFLMRLAPHYEAGYDYVLVNSEVANQEDLFARYVGAVSANNQSGDPSWMEWTEGFSCRRELAIRAGLFPTGFPVLICAGEDGVFGTGLRNLGAKKKIDFSITVDHISPSTFSEYWQIRKGRGKGCPQIRRFHDKWSFWKIGLWAALRILKNLIMASFILPMFWISWSAVRYSKYKLGDLFPFMWAWFIEQVAFHVGEWESIYEIYRVEQQKQK